MNSVSLHPGLIDTQILIEMRAGLVDAHRFAIALMRSARIEVSELSAIALLTQCSTPVALQKELSFLSSSVVHRITARVSERAFRLLAKLPPPCGLTADDAIVAATAAEHKLTLYTLDPARFVPVSGLNALRPY
ncbi:MAG: PIN domain-containing protein [Gemmataceae bacterium]